MEAVLSEFGWMRFLMSRMTDEIIHYPALIVILIFLAYNRRTKSGARKCNAKDTTQVEER